MAQTQLYKYGYNFDEIEKQISKPERQGKPWGSFCRAVNEEIYGMDQFIIKHEEIAILNPKDYQGKEVLLYLKNGQIAAGDYGLAPEDTLFFPFGSFEQALAIKAEKDSIIYVFFGIPQGGGDNKIKKATTFDIRHKDYAENLIETIANRQFTGKKIFFKTGNHHGLHFHCKKTETYFIHSGKLFLRLRAGNGEDRSYVLEPGQTIKITPGLMHQAAGLDNPVIIESSTHDEDTDSFIVESEFNDMPELKEKIKINNN